MLHNLEEQTGKTIISKVELIDRNIKKKKDLLMKINSFFNITNNEDIPLVEKYIITEKKLNDNHPYYKYYKTYRIKKPLRNYNYTDLKEACNKIILSGLSLSYLKYRRFIDNDIFNCLKQPLNYNLINESITIINNLLKNKEINYSLTLSKYTEDFMEALFADEIINDEYIMSLSNLVNLKYNYDLLNVHTKKKWYNIFNKINKTKEEHNLKIFSGFQKEIYEEYMKNYTSIISLKEKLSFLRSVLNEDKYNNEINNIIRNENVYDVLSFYKKIFKIAYNNKATFDLIGKTSKLEKDVLKYSYDDLEEKKEMNELISIIPILKLYLDIEEEETKHLDIINLYNDYDEIIDSIYDDKYKLNNLISKAINYVWDNKLRDGSALLLENINYMSNEALNRFFPCVISNYSKENIEELIYKKFYFEKIIILDEESNKDSDFEVLNKLGKNIIYMSINNIDTFNLNENKNNINDIISNLNNEIFTEIRYYLLNRNINIETNIKKDHMELQINNQKVLLALNPQHKNNELVNGDIFLRNYYKENNIHVYRIWYRDWWLNKSKELNKIEGYVKIFDNTK